MWHCVWHGMHIVMSKMWNGAHKRFQPAHAAGASLTVACSDLRGLPDGHVARNSAPGLFSVALADDHAIAALKPALDWAPIICVSERACADGRLADGHAAILLAVNRSVAKQTVEIAVLAGLHLLHAHSKVRSGQCSAVQCSASTHRSPSMHRAPSKAIAIAQTLYMQAPQHLQSRAARTHLALLV